MYPKTDPNNVLVIACSILFMRTEIEHLDFSLEYFLGTKILIFPFRKKLLNGTVLFAVSIGSTIHNHMVPCLLPHQVRLATTWPDDRDVDFWHETFG